MTRNATTAGRLFDYFDLSRPGVKTTVVGRAREQEILRDELGASLGGHGRLVLLGGEAGIGKTTLAQDLAAQAVVQEAQVLTGHCYDLTNTPPYGPWRDLFADFHRDSTFPAPPTAFASGALTSIADQSELYAEVRQVLATLSTTRPVLIILEDLHWADPASLELLRHAAPYLRHWPILLLVTYRVDELTRRHPFAQQLPALVREADGLRLDLRRLDASALHALVTARFALSGSDTTRLVAYLEQHAEGNPFFATELVRALEEDALLRPNTEHWHLGELDHVAVPTFLRQVIEGRVGKLGDEVRDALATAAVIGQEVPVGLWGEMVGKDEEALLAIVEQAVDARVLTAEQEGIRVHFVHALTREALYEGILPPRRRTRHRRIADILMAGAEADPDVIAAHLQRAGDPRAPEWLIRAGDRAQRAYALLTAVERFRAAAALLARVPGQERTRALLLYRLARLQRFATPAVGVADLDEAERLARVAGDAILAAEARYSRGLLRSYCDDLGGGIAEIEAGIGVLEAFPEEDLRAVGAVEVWLADALPSRVAPVASGHDVATPLSLGGMFHRRAGHAWLLAVSGRLTAAVETGEAATSETDSERPMGSLLTSAAGHAWHGLSVSYGALGRPADARWAAGRARGYYDAVDHHALIAFSLLMELRDIAIPYHADDPDVRHRIAAEAEAALRRAGGALVPGLSPGLAWLACFVLNGQWDNASDIVAALPPPGPFFLRREITATIATLARHRGRADEARQAIAAVLSEGPRAAPGTKVHQEALHLQRLAADLALDAGDLPAARAWLETHDRWLSWNSAVLGQADGLLIWGRYHLVRGDVTTARACANRALALAELPRQPLVLLAAHRLLGSLSGEAGVRDAAVMHLQAALDLAEACTAPFERAQTLLALAEMHRQHQRAPEALACLDEAMAIGSELGAEPLLARAAALRQQLRASPAVATLPFHLTARESEVLRLAATGLTDAAIAERLFISPRTVSQHLRAVYAKLNVSSRAAATRFAIEHGLA